MHTPTGAGAAQQLLSETGRLFTAGKETRRVNLGGCGRQSTGSFSSFSAGPVLVFRLPVGGVFYPPPSLLIDGFLHIFINIILLPSPPLL